MKPTTAIILAAGTGTRMLPITAAIQKELLPILTRPAVDYIVSDLVAAGVTRIIFVIRQGQAGLKDFYSGNAAYEQTLKQLGKTEALAQLDAIHKQAKFEFIEQPQDGGYGTGAAVLTALPHITPDETVLICGGDNFIWRADGSSDLTDFVSAYTASGAEGAVNAITPPEAELSQMGVFSTRADGEHEYLTGIVEKPAPGQAPSGLAGISQYILTNKLLEYLKSVQPSANGEIYLPDAVTAAAKDHQILVHRATGEYIDTGTPEKWLEANQIVAKATKQAS